MIRCVEGLIGVLVCVCTASTAWAEPDRSTFKVDGRHDLHGRYSALIDLTPQTEGYLVTRTVTFSRDGRQEVHVGRAAWTGNKLSLTLSPAPDAPVIKGGAAGKVDAIHASARSTPVLRKRGVEPSEQLHLKLVVDPSSGFCVERCNGTGGNGRALGRVQGKTSLVLPVQAPVKTADLTGWVIKVPGQVRHAVRQGNRVYVAAGEAGLQIVSLEQEAVERAIRLPGVSRHILIRGTVAWVVADLRGLTRIHVVDLALGQLVKTITSKRTAILSAAGKYVAAIGAGKVRYYDAAGTHRGTTHVPRRGSQHPGVATTAGQLLVPLGRGGGLSRIDVATRRTVEMIATRDWLHDVVTVGSTAFVAGSFQGLGLIDLEQRTYRTIGPRHVLRLFARGERVFALTRTAILEFDATGKQVGSTKLGVTLPDAPNGAHWIVDVRDGTALLSLHGVGLVVLEL